MNPHETTQVLVAVSRVEGQMTAVLQMVTNQGDALTKISAEHTQFRDHITTDVSSLRERVGVMEASKKASPPWWVVLGALASIATVITVIALFADRLYSK